MTIRIFLKEEEIIFISLISTMLLFCLLFIISYPGKERLNIMKKKYMKNINNPEEDKNINLKGNKYNKKIKETKL